MYEEVLLKQNRSLEEIKVPFATCDISQFIFPDEKDIANFDVYPDSAIQGVFEAKCTDKYSYLNRNLAPGQVCENDWQCVSSNCNEFRCQGHEEGLLCQSDKQCEKGLFCDSSTNTCAKLKADNEICYKDEMCLIGSICANSIILIQQSQNGVSTLIPSVNLNQKKCQKMFSLKVGEYAQTKELCQTGIIKNLVCRNITSVTYDGKIIEEPFKCIANSSTHIVTLPKEVIFLLGYHALLKKERDNSGRVYKVILIYKLR
ncbi:UNKNOWN [Stylonychia lemnae]|uniref:Dickkopf N-terminal cysteine-rich domain-containing protein n=1 Tax=Stylonychia lemnae TaxID=5949 RepID=A0A078AN97_STYLE|nr:UNKNOWN [Stylonychia lemnae]|eukprot:CDW83644.1 UNKNOWN [Stylonychia lemnae]